MQHKTRIQFPPQDAHLLEQDEVSFYLVQGDEKLRLRFHDYDQIYRYPGLYEQVFYDRLKCSSPKKVGEILKRTLDASEQNFTELRVLDLGAGNGMMGEVMKSYGVARLIGADIIPEARDACYRDRPDTYDEYYVEDFTELPAEAIDEYLDVYHLERYRHRYSMEGTPLYYFALVARKKSDIPADFLQRHTIG